MMRRLGQVVFVGVLALAVLLGYNVVRSNIAADLYRDRLREAVKENEVLRQTFNEAVKKTVVTELVVNEDDTVCVVFVSADNTEHVVPTPFRKGAEVFVDFIVQDGKLFLRRVFDEDTKPREALFINPDLQTVDWKKGVEGPRGSAAYAQLNQNGRWVVNVTGNGALELKKADDNAPRQPLVNLPPVREYPVIEKEMNTKVDEIGPKDVWQTLFGDKRQ
jgi:hypothetical protein